MPDISKLVIEVDSQGVVSGTANLESFANASSRAGSSSDDLARKMGALQLVVGRLPGPLKHLAGGLMGLVSPATAAIGAIMELGQMAVKYVQESIEAFKKYETIQKNLDIVMESAERSKEVFRDLRQMMTYAPVGIEGLSEAAIKLRGVGIAGRDVTDTIRMIGDLSLGSAEKFDKILNAYAMLNAGTGDATRMMRQFAQAGIPVQQMLEQMGVTGKATAEDIKEAFRLMTSEGGQYFQAMERDSRTLVNLESGLEAAREERRALRAELQEWNEFRRWRIETQFDRIDALNEQDRGRVEINRLTDLINSDDITAIERIVAEYTRAEIVVGMYNDAVRRGHTTTANDLGLLNLRAEDTIDNYRNIVNAHREMVAQQERYNELIANAETAYQNMTDKLEDAWAKTKEGQIKALQDQIEEWQNYLELVRYEERNDNSNYYYQTYGNSRSLNEVGISDEDRTQINDVIRGLTESLERLTGKAKDVTPVYADWVKLLASATSYTEEQVNSWRGLGTVNKYAEEGIEAVRDRFLEETPDGLIAELLGMDRTDVFEDAASKMEALVRMMTEARINEPWSLENESYQRAIELLQQYNQLAEDSRGERYLENIVNQIEDAGKSTYELAIQRLMIEERISREAAMQSLEAQKKLDFINGGYDFMGSLSNQMDEALRAIRDAIANDDKVMRGMYGQYASANFGQAGLNAIQGSDAGNFLSGYMESDSWEVGVIEMVVGAIAKVIGGMEGMSTILNAVTAILKELEPLIKTLLLLVLIIARALQWLANVIMTFLNTITDGFFDEMADLYDSLVEMNGERKTEIERLKAINEQYVNLFNAMREQEEYYLTQRRSLNSQFAIENYRQVNDMILSPHGAFSTHPKDYIIATKDPASLMSGGAFVNITVINNTTASVSTQENTSDGIKNIQIVIDGVVQNGLASGRYDNALDASSQRRQGRRIHA